MTSGGARRARNDDVAAAIGTALATAMQAAELRSMRFVEQQLVPQLAAVGDSVAHSIAGPTATDPIRATAAAAARAAAHTAQSAAALETSSLDELLQPCLSLLVRAAVPGSGGVKGVIADEVTSAAAGQAKEAALVLLSSVATRLDKKRVRALLAPYAPDIIHAAVERFPKLRPVVTILRIFGPKDISAEAPPETWKKAQERVLRRLRIVLNDALLTLSRLKGPTHLPSLYDRVATLEGSLKCALPVLLIAGDKGAGADDVVEFLLGGIRPCRARDRPAHLLQQQHHQDGFVVHVFSEGICEWSGDSFAALSGEHPFSFLRARAGLATLTSGDKRTSVTARGTPHPLLRSVIVVQAPALGASRCNGSESAELLNLLDSFVSVSDRVWLVFDKSSSHFSVEMTSMLASHRNAIGAADKFKFLWNFAERDSPSPPHRVDDGNACLRPFGALHFALSRVSRAPSAPHLHLIEIPATTPQRVLRSNEDLLRLICDLTENVPLQFADLRISNVIDILREFAINLRAIRLCAASDLYATIRAEAAKSTLTCARIAAAQKHEMDVVTQLCAELSCRPTDIPPLEWLTVPSSMKGLTTAVPNTVEFATDGIEWAANMTASLRECYGAVASAADPIAVRFSKTVAELLETIGEGLESAIDVTPPRAVRAIFDRGSSSATPPPPASPLGSGFRKPRWTCDDLLSALVEEEELGRCAIMGAAWQLFAEALDEFKIVPDAGPPPATPLSPTRRKSRHNRTNTS